MADLVWSDGLLDDARRARDEVAALLTRLGVPGELVLTGASSVPGVLTKGDIDLHLRVPASQFPFAVAVLARAYRSGSPHAWAATLAVFDLASRHSTGLAVTPIGSVHDRRFSSTWRALREEPRLLEEYNELKRAAYGTSDYEELKSAFFTTIADESCDG